MSLAQTSPRFPSPPPPAEIQFGPKSSSVAGADASNQSQQMDNAGYDAKAKRRIRPGTKAVDMAAGPPLVPLNEPEQLESAFQLQEHLAALHYQHTAGNTTPITRDTARALATPPAGIDRTLWLYELCRFLISQCNSLIVGFLFDTPPCSATTCPEMRASEWQFLCAVHDAPKSCCAIDYCCHTLDWAANIVTNSAIFPSRMVAAGPDRNNIHKNLTNVFRRLHRIFAHAWFQHRGVFWSVEGQTGLYVFFKAVCDLYDLLPSENYKLPPEAEGLEPNTGINGAGAGGASNDERRHSQIQVLTRPQSRGGEQDDDGFQPVGRTNTRRHIRSNPSVGSAVTTVIEADEEDHSDMTNRLQKMRISAPELVEEGAGPEEADVPMMVDSSGQEDEGKTPVEPKAGSSLPAARDQPPEPAEQETSEPVDEDPDATIMPEDHEDEDSKDVAGEGARDVEQLPEQDEDEGTVVGVPSEPEPALGEAAGEEGNKPDEDDKDEASTASAPAPESHHDDASKDDDDSRELGLAATSISDFAGKDLESSSTEGAPTPGETTDEEDPVSPRTTEPQVEEKEEEEVKSDGDKA